MATVSCIPCFTRFCTSTRFRFRHDFATRIPHPETDKTLSSSGQIVASQTVDALIQGTSDALLPSDFYLYITDDFGTSVEEVHPSIERRFGKPADALALASTHVDQPRTVSGTLKGTEWRIISVPLTSTGHQSRIVGNVVIGLPLDQVERTVTNLKQVLTLFVLAIMAIGALVSVVLVRRSLRALRTISHVSSDVRQGNFSARVPPMKPDTEVGELGESVNAMLDEIETLFEAQTASEQRMRRFVSDASHELRTPLATVRGYAELYRMGGVPAEQIPQAFTRIESESGRMANLVEDLLKLARLDERSEIKPKPVDLAAVALNTMSDFWPAAPNAPQTSPTCRAKRWNPSSSWEIKTASRNSSQTYSETSTPTRTPMSQ